MQRGKRILVIILGLLLAACQVPASTALIAELPTQAAAASLPGPSATPTATLIVLDNGQVVPPTWTPQPGHPTVANPGAIQTLSPTGTPTVTPFLPSRTPRPTATATTVPVITPTLGSATPYLPQVTIYPPSANLGPSKLGLHVIRNNDPDIMEFVRRTQPAVIKAVDDLGFLEEVKQVSPYTITIGRFNDNNQHFGGSPEEAARDWVDSQMAIYQANAAYVDYWEGWNEPDPNMDGMSWYARFEQERTRIMWQHGFKVAIGGFSTGVPEFEEFQLFVPAIETALEYGGILSLHEYSAPDITWLYGGALPGRPSYPDRGALAFRYRWFYRDILEPLGLVIPLVISEAGIDGIIGGRPGPSGLGWQDFTGYFVESGWGPDGTTAYINQLGWYDAGVRQDGYVIGFTVFTAGGYGHWASYNINDILPDLWNYVNSQH
ncbi:MAG: hypothetical protein KDE09_17255 [Anaerolineales bacterium]|nr:hypothetical protein [Anaerolineales bacterium]MCB0019544.1 hypothetical protein [Anaerolineales bacterium]MCB8960365.1 hypothetical protein [Ardenticatenales bacterium]